jgi:hypothetical protein
MSSNLQIALDKQCKIVYNVVMVKETKQSKKENEMTTEKFKTFGFLEFDDGEKRAVEVHEDGLTHRFVDVETGGSFGNGRFDFVVNDFMSFSLEAVKAQMSS